MNQDFSDRLLDYLKEGRSLKDLLDFGERTLKCPILFSDRHHMHREISQHYPLPDLKTRFENSEKMTEEEFERTVAEPFRNAMSNLPFTITMPRYKHSHLISKSYWNGRLVGYLMVPGGDRELEKVDRQLLMRLSDACAILGAAELGATLVENSKPAAYILSDLICGRFTSIESFEHRLSGSALRRFGPFRLVHISSGKSGDDMKLLQTVAAQLQSALKEAKIFFCNQNLFLLSEREDLPPELVEQITMLHERFGFVFGVSDCAWDLWELSELHRQATRATELSRILERGTAFYVYDHIRFYDALSHIPPAQRKRYLGNMFRKIQEYDQANKKDYLSTLYCYLKNDGDLTKTSEELFLHKNTLAYRFKRLKELFDLDIECNRDLFKLYFAFAIYNLEERGGP